MNRPTGIIRTLPSLAEGTPGHDRMTRSFAAMEKGREINIYIAINQKPKIEVLHIYILIGGKIICRMNIAGYEDGDTRECWDSTIRKPKYWAICTGPLVRPPEPILRKGFQGIRYTEDLW